MKILSYNINLFKQEKLNKVLQDDADIFILPEVARPELLKLPDEYNMQWIGNCDMKGLGVIWKSELKAEVPEWFNTSFQYILPIIIDGKLILASWPTLTKQNKPKTYPQILMEAIEEYSPKFKLYPTIISGDMNCYVGQSGETGKYNIKAISDYLGEVGFKSAYHHVSHEELGHETAATYYHQFKEDMHFFIDYTFLNVPMKSFTLYPWDKGVSDHVGQKFEIARV